MHGQARGRVFLQEDAHLFSVVCLYMSPGPSCRQLSGFRYVCSKNVIQCSIIAQRGVKKLMMVSESQAIVPSLVTIRSDLDIVAARMAARDLSRKIGFNTIDQARIATVASELARNIIMYANEGTVTLSMVQHSSHCGIEMMFEDHGPGIAPEYHPPKDINLDDTDSNGTDVCATNGHKRLGLAAARRMVDELKIATAPQQQGTTIICRKWLR